MATLPLESLRDVEGSLIHELHPVRNSRCIRGCNYYQSQESARPRVNRGDLIRADVLLVTQAYATETGEAWISSKELARRLMELSGRPVYARRSLLSLNCMVRDAVAPRGVLSYQRDRVRGYFVEDIQAIGLQSYDLYVH